MRDFFIWAGMALCAFSLWAIARHDWLRLTTLSRQVNARVTGYRTSWDDGSKSYAAIYSFTAEGGDHEVVDQVYGPSEQPPLDTVRALTYPAGRPDLARPPRPVMWGAVYAFLVLAIGLLFSAWMGWIE